VPLGRGEPLVLRSGVESGALLALVLRREARCTRRLACATRAGHSLLSVLPPKKLREPIAGPPRDGELAQLCRKLLRWRDLSLLVARGALVVHSRSTSWRARDTSCRSCQEVSRM
jgi:hypothetical protein